MPAPTPPSDLSPSEYQLWKDAQLLGHFSSWKHERRENRARIERLEADVSELRKLVTELNLASTPSAAPSPHALPRNPVTATGVTPLPTAAVVTPTTTSSTAATPAGLHAIPEDGESVPAAKASGNGVKWADRERDAQGMGGKKALRSMCDVE